MSSANKRLVFVVGLVLLPGFPFEGRAQTSGTYTTFDVPGTTNGTWPVSINGQGQVVGYYYDAGGSSRVFVWDGTTFNSLDVPGAVYTFPVGINDKGQVAGWYDDADNARHSFVWNGKFYTKLDVPGAANGTVAIGINNS